MLSDIVSTAKRRIETNSHISSNMASVCYAIIDYVSVGAAKKPHLTFTDLYRISPKVDEDVFYDAVFLLTKHQYNILKQQFEALHPRKGFQPVPDREEIIEAMKNDDFFNPITGEDLTEEEFGKQVITFFSPSDDLIRAIKSD